MQSNEYQLTPEKNYVFLLLLIYHYKNLHYYTVNGFTSTKALGVDKFIEDLACAPWNTITPLTHGMINTIFGKLYLTPLLKSIIAH